MVTGKTFSFEDAKQLGLVNEIFERDSFMERVMEYARQFCPPNKAAKAVGRIKRAVQTGWEIPLKPDSPWSAKISSCSSRATMQERVWLHSSRSGKPYLWGNSSSDCYPEREL
jgi:enoyl-CoA hydratase/carnithine racemase